MAGLLDSSSNTSPNNRDWGLDADLNKTISRKTGYTGGFAPGEYESWAGENPGLAANYQAPAPTPPNANNGAPTNSTYNATTNNVTDNTSGQNLGSVGNAGLNQAIAGVVGYTGGFAPGEFESWSAQNQDKVKNHVVNYIPSTQAGDASYGQAPSSWKGETGQTSYGTVGQNTLGAGKVFTGGVNPYAPKPGVKNQPKPVFSLPATDQTSGDTMGTTLSAQPDTSQNSLAQSVFNKLLPNQNVAQGEKPTFQQTISALMQSGMTQDQAMQAAQSQPSAYYSDGASAPVGNQDSLSPQELANRQMAKYTADVAKYGYKGPTGQNADLGTVEINYPAGYPDYLKVGNLKPNTVFHNPTTPAITPTPITTSAPTPTPNSTGFFLPNGQPNPNAPPGSKPSRQETITALIAQGLTLAQAQAAAAGQPTSYYSDGESSSDPHVNPETGGPPDKQTPETGGPPDRQNPETGGPPDYLPVTPAPIPQNPYTPPVVPSPVPPLAPANSASTTQSMLDVDALARRNIDADRETVAGQLNGLLSANSQYVQAARDKTMRAANARGLLNSSMAASAGEEAAINAALPIATSDAGIYGKASDYNVALENQGRMYNTETGNKFASQNLGINADAATQGRNIEANAESQRQTIAANKATAEATAATNTAMENMRASIAAEAAKNQALVNAGVASQAAITAKNAAFEEQQAKLVIAKLQQETQNSSNVLDNKRIQFGLVQQILGASNEMYSPGLKRKLLEAAGEYGLASAFEAMEELNPGSNSTTTDASAIAAENARIAKEQGGA